MSAPLRVNFLGGLGRIGRNCAALELDGQVLLIDCMNPRAAQNALANLPGISAMAQIGASLRVLGDDSADVQSRIVANLRTAGIDARVEAARPNLEDVFVAATRGVSPAERRA